MEHIWELDVTALYSACCANPRDEDALAALLVARKDWQLQAVAEVRCEAGLDWAGLDWAGLDWAELDWAGLDWARLG